MYRYWLDDIKDWCISRQLWWGHRIPVWYPEGVDFEADPKAPFVVARTEEDAYARAEETGLGKKAEGFKLTQVKGSP